MSRKDYEAIAKAISNWASTKDVDAHIWEYLVNNIADVMANGNSKFDRNRFYSACVGEPK